MKRVAIKKSSKSHIFIPVAVALVIFAAGTVIGNVVYSADYINGGKITGAAFVIPRRGELAAADKITDFTQGWHCGGPIYCREYLVKDCKLRPGCVVSGIWNWAKCTGVPQQDCEYYDDPITCEELGCKWMQ